MAYSTNPYLAKARALALQLLVRDKLPVQTVANRCGVHRSTIWRWKQKWDRLNEHVQLENENRPDRTPGVSFRQAALRWHVPTLSSRPHTSPHAVSEAIGVSLSSVRRILRRYHLANGRKKRVRPDNPHRPHATKPGELVETDTIHHVDPTSGRRLYYYTVIDLFTRMTHVILVPKLSPGLAAQAVLEAQHAWGFPISMVQADNGPEYGRYFEQRLHGKGIQTRHSRLHRPNDNAHIERFNRTIQTECIGYFWRKSVPLSHQRDTLTAYLDYYNNQRVHLGIQMRVPAAMLQRF